MASQLYFVDVLADRSTSRLTLLEDDDFVFVSGEDTLWRFEQATDPAGRPIPGQGTFRNVFVGESNDSSELVRSMLDAIAVSIDNRRDLFNSTGTLMAAITALEARVATLETTSTDHENRITGVEGTSTQSSEVTSGEVVTVSDSFSADLDTSINNPSVKMFNTSDSSFYYTSTSGGEVLSGGIDNGRTVVIHHSTVGPVHIDFTIVPGTNVTSRANQVIVIESAGG